MDKLKGAVIALSIVALAHLIAWYGDAGNRGGYILQSTDCK